MTTRTRTVRSLHTPEEYLHQQDEAVPLAPALMSVAATLMQIRDVLAMANELTAADPAIAHVIATRQIITEMQGGLDGSAVANAMGHQLPREAVLS